MYNIMKKLILWLILILIILLLVLSGCSVNEAAEFDMANTTTTNTDSNNECSYNKYNCPNFTTHTEAQSVYLYCIRQGKGDVHHLDRDGDGSACETLP